MKANRRSLSLLCAGGLLLASGHAIGQSDTMAAVEADVANWSDGLSAAFAPGYWEGELKVFDGAGNIIDRDATPSCIKPGEGNKMGGELAQAMGELTKTGKCRSVSGGRRSLNLTLTCALPDGSNIVLKSSGNYDPTTVNWNFELEVPGGTGSGMSRMTVSAKRTRATC